jgi:hypothetical protein
MSASVGGDGTLRQEQAVGSADSFLNTSSDDDRAVAAWLFGFGTWVSSWHQGDGWSKPVRLGFRPDTDRVAPLAVTTAGTGAAAIWRSRAFDGGGSFSRQRGGIWTKASSIASTALSGEPSAAQNFGAARLSSEEMVLLGIGSDYLEVLHIPPAGRPFWERLPIERGGNPSPAAGGGAAAFAWEASLGEWEPDTDQHLFVWVYRP